MLVIDCSIAVAIDPHLLSEKEMSLTRPTPVPSCSGERTSSPSYDRLSKEQIAFAFLLGSLFADRWILEASHRPGTLSGRPTEDDAHSN